MTATDREVETTLALIEAMNECHDAGLSRDEILTIVVAELTTGTLAPEETA